MPNDNKVTVNMTTKKLPEKITAEDVSLAKRVILDSTLLHRFFCAPSFEIYGGVSGFYDYGPPGCAIMRNLINEWRKKFIIEDDLLEVYSSIVTPSPVFKSSGHVDRFTDYMVQEKEGQEVFRADHVIKQVLKTRMGQNSAGAGGKKIDDNLAREYNSIIDNIDGYNGKKLKDIIEKHDIKSPSSNMELGDVSEFNLMFGTYIGPSSNNKAYLRPETAQSQFLNFKRLYEFNGHALPFGSASIGTSFRNEISPRQGTIRLREFSMAEIEYFFDPENTSFHKFNSVRDVCLPLLTSEAQISPTDSKILHISVGEAINKGILKNQIMAYYLVKVYSFLVSIGIHKTHIRLRQHLPNELAHYSRDCWDAEINISYGWIECVGCADRSAYDLAAHMKSTGENLSARVQLQNPVSTECIQLSKNIAEIAKVHKPNVKYVTSYLDSLSEFNLKNQKILQEMKSNLESKGFVIIKCNDANEYKLDNSMVSIKMGTNTIHVREFIPNVVEPSFGLDRILYSVLEHSFYIRDSDESRNVFQFLPNVAPYKVFVMPLSKSENLCNLAREIKLSLTERNIGSRIDESGRSIGKRYARSDEIGVPFVITVDFQSVEDQTVTLRERDSMKQQRIKIEHLIAAVDGLSNHTFSWDQLGVKFEAKALDS